MSEPIARPTSWLRQRLGAPAALSASGQDAYLSANVHPRWLWILVLLTGAALSFGQIWAMAPNPHPEGHLNATVVLLLGFWLTGASTAYFMAARDHAARIRRLDLTVSREVQEHCETQKMLHQCEKELRESKERYRLLCESAPAVIVTLDLEGRLTSCNPCAEAVTGWAREEWMHKSFLPLVYAEDFPEAHRFFATALGGGKPPTTEIRVLDKAGEPVPIEFTVTPQMEGSRICGVLAIGRDLSARREVEQGQARLQAQLRRSQKMEALGTLAGGIAHDFNNILTAIVSNVELARMEIAAVQPAAERLDEIRMACARAAELVGQILAFSRQQDQERRCVSLESIVQEATKLLRSTLPVTIEMQTEFAGNCPCVLADSGQMHQVLLNLGTNAAHAMRERNGKLQVSVRAVDVDDELAARIPDLQPGHYVRLSVSDNGHGMSAATVERIFDPFFTTKAPGEGTGLGLAMVQGIVRSHKGAIAVCSEPGQGTVFHLYFPAVQSDSPDAEFHLCTIPRGNGELILFVDDESAILAAGRQILLHLGYDVVACGNAVTALDVLKGRPRQFSCVITDLSMPSMTGLELARECQRLHPGLLVILTTGYTGELTGESAQAQGIREVLEKPFTLQLLAETVHRVLNKHRQCSS
jgi:PAS domain S-box-containing protein